MKKAAILISGHVRDFERTLPQLTALVDYVDGDVFIASYDRRAVGVRFWQGQEHSNDTLIETDYIQIEQALQPKKTVFSESVNIPEKLKDYSFKNKLVNIEGVYKMFYKVWESNQLKMQYESTHNFKYDMVIRTRFDNEYLHVDFSKFNPELILTARSDHRAYMTDTFFVAGTDRMNRICEIVKHIGTELPTQQYYNAEHMLTAFCTSMKVPILANGDIKIKLRDKLFT